jgi:molybdopterin-binding protein
VGDIANGGLSRVSWKHDVALFRLLLALEVYRWCMALSARNQLQGRITKIKLGDIMAHVVVKLGKITIESVITRQSADEMKLKKGDTVEVVIKSTEVMLKK